MGSYTPRGLYKPEVGEVGWGVLVDDNFDIIDDGLGGIGGGGSVTGWLDATLSPYSADPTAATFSDAALQNVFDAAFTRGPGTGVYLPGNFMVKSNIAHFEVGGISVYMPPGASLVLGDDTGGDSIFSNLGRHGYGNNQSTTDLRFIGITADGSENAFNGDLWGDWWQGEDHQFLQTTVRNWHGSIWGFTGCRRPIVDGFMLENVGAAENGAVPIDWHHSDEGGTIGRLTEYGTLTNGTIKDSDDFAVFWALTLGCKATNLNLLGSGQYRSAFYLVDGDSCHIIGNRVSGASEDGIHLQSRGLGNSRNNVVVGNIVDTSGSGIDIHEAAYNAGQSHSGNVIANNVGVVQRD